MWANEITTSVGMLDPYTMANAMDFLGLDYSRNKNTIYAEGGIKSWIRFDTAGHNQVVVPGLRELFYRHTGEVVSLTLGLQSAQGDDFYLVNERMVGANLRVALPAWDIGAMGGTVVKPFARNGNFCSVGYLYSVVPRRPRMILGSELGQTNFGLITLSYHPSKDGGDQSASGNEFASDEFASDGGAAKPTEAIKVNTIGGLFYDEYGTWKTNPVLLKGLYSEIEFWEVMKLKPEVLFQNGPDQDALLYSMGWESQIAWSNGFNTKAMARYVGFFAIDSGSRPQTSFSNIFAGDILRLDAIDAPFVQAGIKQSFPSIKTSIKLQMARQIGQLDLTAEEIAQGRDGKRMTEYDATLGKTFGEHVLLNLTGGFVDYFFLKLPVFPATVDSYDGFATLFGKMELRITF